MIEFGVLGPLLVRRGGTTIPINASLPATSSPCCCAGVGSRCRWALYRPARRAESLDVYRDTRAVLATSWGGAGRGATAAAPGDPPGG